MRDKDAAIEPSFGARYMSPLVKQDLARLDKDGESRRSAMNSLKQFVEHLDPGSMPRFLAQVSETDQGPSRSYAISLYEDVARVHGKLIIPHIPRVMATVARSLSSSGSSPQLHQACAKVVSAVAKHSVEGGSAAEADAILRQLCDPLLDVLAGKLEPLAAGAAVCLQALVECEKWKYASDEVVNDACLRATVALGDKTTRTVAHMQLARSLASTNPAFFNSYGVALLRTGSEVLRNQSASGTWQQRACAARLLQAVLPTVDSATLASELDHTVQALDECKHDRMAHVRTAVSEALKTARNLGSDDKSRRLTPCDDGEDSPLLAAANSLNLASLAVVNDEKRPGRRNSLAGSEDLLTSGSNQGSSPVAFSEESMVDSPFSFAPPGSPISAAQFSLEKHRRSPLFPTATVVSTLCSPRTSSSVVSVDDLQAYLNNPGGLCEAQAKENEPSKNRDVNGIPCDSGPSSSTGVTIPCSSQAGKRPRPTAPELELTYPPLHVQKMGIDQQSGDIDGSSVVMSKRRGGMSYGSLENSVITDYRKQEGVGLHVDDEDASSNVTFADIEVEVRNDFECDSLSRKHSTANQVGRHFGPGFNIGISKGGLNLNGQSMKNASEPKESAVQMTSQSVGGHNMDDDVSARSGVIRNCYCKETFESMSYGESSDSSLPRSRSPEDLSSPQMSQTESRALITAEDFLPFSTPRRLVRSLQKTVSNPHCGKSGRDLNTKLQEDLTELPDMDLDTCSEGGWSVRDNPIASENSFKSESAVGEQGGNVCSKMTIDSSSTNYLLKKDDSCTTECDRLSYALLHVADSLFCTATGRALEPECLKEDMTADDNSVAPAHSQGNTHSLAQENIPPRENVSGRKQALKVGDYLLEDIEENDAFLPLERIMDRVVGVFLQRFRLSLSDSFLNSLKSIWTYTEVLLGGFLLVVLAIPFAMVLSKVLQSSFDHSGLIPT